MFTRTSDDWIGRVLTDDAMLTMPEIGIELPLAEVYDGRDFSTSDAAPGSED